jgi:hypothetical protein
MIQAKSRIIDLPKINEGKGNLTFMEGGKEVPFQIKRVYYLYDIPSAQMRGGHAHKNLEQLLIAVNGSFDVMLDDGKSGKQTIHLNRPHQGLYIPPMFWRELSNFSAGGVCLVLASDAYSESDYIRDHQQFLKLAAERI